MVCVRGCVCTYVCVGVCMSMYLSSRRYSERCVRQEVDSVSHMAPSPDLVS